jgi:hypothetical protein
MDTEAIYSEIMAYGRARARGRIYEEDTEHHLAEIKRLLKEAEEERAELLAENERLHDLAGGWRPIESAPIDGTAFLATGHDFGNTANPRHYIVAQFDSEHGYFCQEDNTGYMLQHLTHWKPLSPPEAA